MEIHREKKKVSNVYNNSNGVYKINLSNTRTAITTQFKRVKRRERKKKLCTKNI